MTENKLRSVIDQLKKGDSSSSKQEAEEKPKEPKQPSDEEMQQLIAKRISDLQNNGIANLEMLGQLSEINKTLALLTETIVKALGDEDETAKKQD